MGSSKKQLSTGASGHALDKQTQVFEATLTGSFRGVRIPSVTSRSSCSKQTSPIAVHMKRLSTKRRVDSNVLMQLCIKCRSRKKHFPRLQAVWFLLTSAECCNFPRSCIRIHWTFFQFCSFVTTLLANFVHASRSSGRIFNVVHSSQSS